MTDDTIRSLAISQRLGPTTAVFLVHHTDCGLLTITDEGFARQLEREVGRRPDWDAGAFSDLEDDVRRSMVLVEESPYLPMRNAVRGFVHDVTSGHLGEVGRNARAFR